MADHKINDIPFLSAQDVVDTVSRMTTTDKNLGESLTEEQQLAILYFASELIGVSVDTIVSLV